jgi:tRNA nucleotidyltransferase/poly(A) polymerase
MNTNNIRTIATGKAFGVINVFTNQGEYEIATFRHDIGSDGRRPDSYLILKGMLRRDLTINALLRY